MPESRPVHDVQVLRAIAHPVRNRILNELAATGSMRAADIARELGIPANQASFHLRQLAKYGLVEEDPAAARDRRDRVWRTVPGQLSIEMASFESEPEAKAAADVYMRSAGAWAHALVDHAYGGERTPDTHRSTVEGAVRLTKAEAEAFSREIGQLLERWNARDRGPDEDRRTYILHAMLQPYPEVGGPAEGDA